MMKTKQKHRRESEINLPATRHALQRASQRGIKKLAIQMIINQGRLIHKQGLKFYFITKKQLKNFDLYTRELLQNVIVVVSNDDDSVITCYKNEKAVGRIKHKPKRLTVYPA